jgi:hypothetical protein
MRKPNKCGCIPCEDVCLAHDEPLICKHGCSEAEEHKCNGYDNISELKEKSEND